MSPSDPILMPASLMLNWITSGVTAPAVQPSVTISSGGLDYLVIRDGPNEGGSIVTTRALTTDNSLTLYAAGYDAADNYLGDQDVTWSITGTLGGSGSSGTSFAFNPNVAPASGTIEAETGGIVDATGMISISVGILDELRIRDAANGAGGGSG